MHCYLIILVFSTSNALLYLFMHVLFFVLLQVVFYR